MPGKPLLRRVSIVIAHGLAVLVVGGRLFVARGGPLTLHAGILMPSVPIIPSPKGPTRPWRIIEGRFAQLESLAIGATEPASADEATGGRCPPGMIEIEGNMKQGADVEQLQNSVCNDWISRTFPERCASFDPTRWTSIAEGLGSASMHYCIDQFEYPNRKGEYPIVLAAYEDAVALCGREGKRLCSESEWTFACEGEAALPYPYGYRRSSDACVIDRPWTPVDERAIAERTTERAIAEVDRLFQAEPSGSRLGCRSPFGVFDMTGNVDEWTRSVRPGERPSILKGGYWGPIRARCRASTRAHGESFAFYQIGFRCCQNVADEP